MVLMSTISPRKHKFTPFRKLSWSVLENSVTNPAPDRDPRPAGVIGITKAEFNYKVLCPGDTSTRNVTL